MTELRDHQSGQRVEIPFGDRRQLEQVAKFIQGHPAVQKPGPVRRWTAAGSSSTSPTGMSPTMASRMSVSVSRPSTVPYSSRTTATRDPDFLNISRILSPRVPS